MKNLMVISSIHYDLQMILKLLFLTLHVLQQWRILGILCILKEPWFLFSHNNMNSHIVDFLKNIRTTYHITFQLKNNFFFIWKNQVKINFISQSLNKSKKA